MPNRPGSLFSNTFSFGYALIVLMLVATDCQAQSPVAVDSLRFVGAVSNSNEKFAIIEDRRGSRQDVFESGQQVFDSGYRVVSVSSSEVCLSPVAGQPRTNYCIRSSGRNTEIEQSKSGRTLTKNVASNSSDPRPSSGITFTSNQSEIAGENRSLQVAPTAPPKDSAAVIEEFTRKVIGSGVLVSREDADGVNGIEVNSIADDSFLFGLGLATGDFIVMVNGREVESPLALGAALRKEQKEGSEIFVRRQGKLVRLAIPNK